MRNKKLAAIITGGTMVGSLLLGGNAYAVTDTTVPSIQKPQNSELIRKTRSSSRRTTNIRHSNLNATSTHRFIGTIRVINGSNLTITGSQMWNNHGSTTPSVTYTVNTTDGTVYMKNGKLDSLSDLTVGQRVVIFGQLDSTMSIIKASGINVMAPKPITLKKNHAPSKIKS